MLTVVCSTTVSGNLEVRCTNACFGLQVWRLVVHMALTLVHLEQTAALVVVAAVGKAVVCLENINFVTVKESINGGCLIQDDLCPCSLANELQQLAYTFNRHIIVHHFLKLANPLRAMAQQKHREQGINKERKRYSGRGSCRVQTKPKKE
jgi:hypothetical protein